MNLPLKGADHKPVLVVLCGPSHAGKTAFANRLSRCGGDFAIVSPDKIRKQLSVGFQDSRYESRVWNTYESMKRQALEKGCNVVLDACHITKKARWHALQGPNNNYKKICIVFDSSWQTIRERCLNERRVSLKEVRRMWKAFQQSKPDPEELKLHGFDVVCFIMAEGDCCDTSKQRCFIFHHLRAGLSAWPEGQWYNNKEVNYG